MLLLIDNYDSFAYNLVHLLAELGLETQVARNDAMTAAEIADLAPDAVILSPGPKDPDHAGVCLQLVQESGGGIPIFGVCLGCQVVAQAFGGRIVRAPEPVHGKLDRIHHDGDGLFAGIKDGFAAARYHSLMVEADSLPETLVATAHNAGGIVMALRHRQWPVFGVQFHPESIASEHGRRILANFAAAAGLRLPSLKRP